MAYTSANDKSGCPYYVDQKFCTGKRCIYTGIRIKDVSILTDSTWEIDFYNTTKDIHILVTQDTFNGVSVTYLNEAAEIISAAILAESTEIVDGLDHVCVTVTLADRPDMQNGCGVIYAGNGWDIELTGSYGVDDGLDYLKDGGEKATIYHLCHNIALNMGSCREFSAYTESKNCNIYSGKFFDPVESHVIKWSQGGFPIMLDNCLICDLCVKNCPRSAIHNKIDGSHRAISDMELTGLTANQLELREQYAINAKAVSGERAYRGGGGVGGEEEVFGGRIFISAADPSLDPNNNVTDFDLWFDLNDIEEV